MITSWLSLAFDVAANTFAIVCVFEGVRRLSAYGASKAALFIATFGLLYCLGYASFNYWAHNIQKTASVVLHKGLAIPELPTDWGANLPPEQRARESLELAHAAFSENGILRHHIDETGRRLLYVPNQGDLDEREKKVARLAQLEYAAAGSSDSWARWLLAAFAAALFGFIWDRGQSANPPLENGRRKGAAPLN